MDAILKGDAGKAVDTAKKGIDSGVDPLDLMNNGFISGINQVGDLFETGRLFLPQLVMSASAMEKATEIINAAIPAEREGIRESFGGDGRRRCTRYWKNHCRSLVQSQRLRCTGYREGRTDPTFY